MNLGHGQDDDSGSKIGETTLDCELMALNGKEMTLGQDGKQL